MTDFLIFIGPYKTLAYGVVLGVVIGSLFAAWVSHTPKKLADISKEEAQRLVQMPNLTPPTQ